MAGAAPKGWMFTKIDSSAGVASAVMKIPTIVDFDERQDPWQTHKKWGLGQDERGDRPRRNPPSLTRWHGLLMIKLAYKAGKLFRPAAALV